MDLQLLASVAVFAIATTGTPGPNNMMLTASGANFGYWRTLPHLIGITLGVATLIITVAAGLGILFQQFPLVQQLLKVVASGYLLWLSWKIATARSARFDSNSESRPMSLFAAAMFQFVNPKAWMMAITAVGSFTLSGGDYWHSVIWVAVMFMLCGFPCTSLWAAFGTLVGRLLSSPRAWRWFNGVMGALTAGCLFFIW
ncbi:LysE family translocator [Marinobacterium jannaschii]|uniref:LysE family translocator n=1 Tax=Marinobacterium jannaschii TaxID=64970 RepID=UPI00047FE512|nr:LysE family translocator [Marinobacterium jannaschii]